MRRVLDRQIPSSDVYCVSPAVTSRYSNNMQPTPVVAGYRHLKPYRRICIKLCIGPGSDCSIRKESHRPQQPRSYHADSGHPSTHAAVLTSPAHYFPNAVYCPYTYSPHELLADRPLWEVAKWLHELIRSVEAQQMQKTNRWVAAQPDKSRIRLDYSFSNGSFTVSHWAKFDMYLGVDFEVDPDGQALLPALVSPPFTEISLVDGLAMILSTEEQASRSTQKESVSGTYPCAIDVNLTLSEPVWRILDQDEDIRRYIVGRGLRTEGIGRNSPCKT